MAKRPASISAKSTAKRIRRSAGPTFIQRSRSESSEQKAIWHNESGAGKSRVRRQFFELGTDDQVAVKEGLERLLQDRIERAGSQ